MALLGCGTLSTSLYTFETTQERTPEGHVLFHVFSLGSVFSQLMFEPRIHRIHPFSTFANLSNLVMKPSATLAGIALRGFRSTYLMITLPMHQETQYNLCLFPLHNQKGKHIFQKPFCLVMRQIEDVTVQAFGPPLNERLAFRVLTLEKNDRFRVRHLYSDMRREQFGFVRPRYPKGSLAVNDAGEVGLQLCPLPIRLHNR